MERFHSFGIWNVTDGIIVNIDMQLKKVINMFYSIDNVRVKKFFCKDL